MAFPIMGVSGVCRPGSNRYFGEKFTDAPACLAPVQGRDGFAGHGACSMPTSSRAVRHIRRAATLCDDDLSDAQLLDGFLATRDEAAFEALVRRHGPMVLGVCRRVVGNAADADDAFQATFLVLVRRAAAVANRELLGNRVHGGAVRPAPGGRARPVR